MLHPVCAILVFAVSTVNCLFNATFLRHGNPRNLCSWTLLVLALLDHSGTDYARVSGISDLPVLCASLLLIVEPFDLARGLLLLIASVGFFQFGDEGENSAEVLRVALLLSLVVAAVARAISKPRNPCDMELQEIVEMNDEDLFQSRRDPFSRFGLLGKYLLLSLMVESLVRMLPPHLQADAVLYLIHVAQSASSLGLLFIPAFFGCSVQTVKHIARREFFVNLRPTLPNE